LKAVAKRIEENNLENLNAFAKTFRLDYDIGPPALQNVEGIVQSMPFLDESFDAAGQEILDVFNTENEQLFELNEIRLACMCVLSHFTTKWLNTNKPGLGLGLGDMNWPNPKLYDRSLSKLAAEYADKPNPCACLLDLSRASLTAKSQGRQERFLAPMIPSEYKGRSGGKWAPERLIFESKAGKTLKEEETCLWQSKKGICVEATDSENLGGFCSRHTCQAEGCTRGKPSDGERCDNCRGKEMKKSVPKSAALDTKVEIGVDSDLTVVRIKSKMTDKTRADKQCLINLKFAPAGVTYGKLVQMSIFLDCIEESKTQNSEVPAPFWDLVEVVLKQPQFRKKQVEMVMEIQVWLPFFLEEKKENSLFYTISRAADLKKMVQDFGKTKGANPTLSYSKERADRERQLENALRRAEKREVAGNGHGKEQRKLVAVGDGAAGLTCLIIVFSQNRFPVEYVPTVFENYVADALVDGQLYEIALWDTAGQEDYDRLRPLSYPDSDVVLIGYSIVEPDTLENVMEKWVPEVRHFCPGVPYVLVGLKLDAMTVPSFVADLKAKGQRVVSLEDGEATAQKIGAYAHVRCSGKMKIGVPEVFETCMRASNTRKGRKKKGCSLL
jgi:Ras family protein A